MTAPTDTPEALARFGHHPDPAIDFVVEVEAIEGELADLAAGLTPTMDIDARIARAMMFRVGANMPAISAKTALRQIEAGRLAAASAASLVAEHDVPIHWPTAWRDVLLERHRQTTKEGWAARHDDEHSSGAMALAAACYACNSATWSQRNASIPAADYLKFSTPGFRWPWATKWWKPKSQRQDLVRAGALILAEIERLDRQEKKQ